MRLRRFRPTGCWMTSSRTLSTKSSEQAIAVAGWCGRLGDRITTKLLHCMSPLLAQSGHRRSYEMSAFDPKRTFVTKFNDAQLIGAEGFTPSDRSEQVIKFAPLNDAFSRGSHAASRLHFPSRRRVGYWLPRDRPDTIQGLSRRHAPPGSAGRREIAARGDPAAKAGAARLHTRQKPCVPGARRGWSDQQTRRDCPQHEG